MGLAWHQGWNDRINGEFGAAYEDNLVNLIKDVRNDLNIPELPFVVANSGFDGWFKIPNSYAWKVKLQLDAQAAIANTTKYPEFEGNIGTVETRGFFRPTPLSQSGQSYHWSHNYETYHLIGEGLYPLSMSSPLYF